MNDALKTPIDNSRIILHHIGGRAGTAPFQHREFADDFLRVLYDADADCIEHMNKSQSDFGGDSLSLPYCLAGENGPITFNLSYDPYGSSTMILNEKYSDYYSNAYEYDYVLGDTMRTMEKRTLEGVTLDTLLDKNPDFPPPDFLSLDTEGSEYEILEGSTRTLKSSVLAIVVETQFIPIHKGQKLFGDISASLNEQGFAFVGFTHLGELAPYRGPVGARAKGGVVVTDAIFARDIENIGDDTSISKLDRYIRLRKLAFFSICYGYIEHALLYLNIAKQLDVDLRSEASVACRSYDIFLSQLEKSVDALGDKRLPLFSQFHKFDTYKKSCNRFSPTSTLNANTDGNLKSVIKRLIGYIPFLLNIFKAIRKFQINFPEKLRKFIAFRIKKRTDLELLLIKNGFVGVADEVRRCRIGNIKPSF
ncbi:MAG: FkbM family methyltransferase [Alphaproteobacteria bacterium]